MSNKNKTKWVDITKRCKTSHYDDDPGSKSLERAYLYDIKTGNILWFLGARGWVRCLTHLNGRDYRTSKGRIYRREES